MTGHVFHPGHDELHGVTVVVDTSAGQTIVGRFHDVENGTMRLHDVAIHEGGEADSRAEFLRRTQKFGVRVDRKFIAVPEAAVVGLVRLSALSA